MNLLLLGRAHSNVFDGRRVMGDGSGDATTGGRRGEGEEGGDSDRVVLTGVPQRGRVGFLTLFEAYKHVEVGSRWTVGKVKTVAYLLFLSIETLALKSTSSSKITLTSKPVFLPERGSVEFPTPFCEAYKLWRLVWVGRRHCHFSICPTISQLWGYFFGLQGTGRQP